MMTAMTDEQYADILAFAGSRGTEAEPVRVSACLPFGDAPRFVDTDSNASHLGGPVIYVSQADFVALNRRVMAESVLG
jgi:hypothetical protein